ncbi:MAG: hypothetical protein K2H79_08370, partial [Bacteroidaceae bacterium]|nr:hypothetical protein [Bacteroidaceae bacterium]
MNGRKWLLLLSCFLMFFPYVVNGQHITTLNWDELRIDSVLPVYTEVIPLESDYRRYDYTVAVEYPEWAPLTADEVRRLKRIGTPIAETLQIHSSVSVCRKQGMLDVAFVPIVKKGNNYRKLLSASITITPVAKVAPQHGARSLKKAVAPAERYTRNSVLASGRWVKIAITSDGMYRLTRSMLKGMGFANPDNVRLYGYG